MRKRNSNNRLGMSLVELMVALGAGSILLVSGLQVMSLMLEALMQEGLRVDESTNIQSDLDQLQRALDAVVRNPFEMDVSLEVETITDDAEIGLIHLVISGAARVDGNSWQWKAPGKQRILVDREWGGDASLKELFPIVLRFPDSRNARFREGVAIHGIW